MSVACQHVDRVMGDQKREPPTTAVTASNAVVTPLVGDDAAVATSEKGLPKDDCYPQYAAVAAVDGGCVNYCREDRHTGTPIACATGETCTPTSWLTALGDPHNTRVCVPKGVVVRAPVKDAPWDSKGPQQLQTVQSSPKMPTCAPNETLVGEDGTPPFCRVECKTNSDCPSHRRCDTSRSVFYVDDKTGDLQHRIGGIHVCEAH